MQLESVSVECYPPPSGTPKDGNGQTSYIYDPSTTTFLNNSVIRMFS
jgi:hypothetical protein